MRFVLSTIRASSSTDAGSARLSMAAAAGDGRQSTSTAISGQRRQRPASAKPQKIRRDSMPADMATASRVQACRAKNISSPGRRPGPERSVGAEVDR